MGTLQTRYWPASIDYEKLFYGTKTEYMNAELVKHALEAVVDPYVLVNLISRRVRQLNAGGGDMSRPLIANTGNLGVADIALTEIIEERMGFEMPEFVELTRPSGRHRNRPQGWTKPNAPAKKLAA